ncbi:MAG: DnaT-like ssDNA-binding protein [Hyphomicrobium sp.]|uniref:DnaT-like ssDNA-binding protein n=1 Tax=Hyphomicrobium sp. TaxID=82 RepID=UPI0035614317
MALTVETGAGLSNADALISLAGADAYHLALEHSTWTGADADKEAAIRRATSYLSNSVIWSGVRTRARDQALAWPRAGMIDREGYGIGSDEIPIEIERAAAELALQELVSPGSMAATVTASDAVKREKIGQIEVEYANAMATAAAHIPVLTIVRDLIAPFISSKAAASNLVGESYRA